MQRLRDMQIQGGTKTQGHNKDSGKCKDPGNVKIQEHKNSMMNRKGDAPTLKQKGSFDAQTLICRDPWAHRDRKIYTTKAQDMQGSRYAKTQVH